MVNYRFGQKLLLVVPSLVVLLFLINRWIPWPWTVLPFDLLLSALTSYLLLTFYRAEIGRVQHRVAESLTNDFEKKWTQLQQQQTLPEAILGSLVESVIAMDERGRILFINPAAEQLFNVQAGQVTGRRLLEALRHSPLNEVISQTLGSQQAIQQEILVHAPAEHILTVQTMPVTYNNNRAGVVVALHDITELRKLEHVRQEFVANASHELKTPLTSIKGFVETLLGGALEDPKHNRSFLETIQEQTNRLMRLIEDLLDLSAIEAKRVPYQLEAVSIAEVATRLLRALSPMANARNIRLQNKLDDALPKVRADREKLAQILMNLLDNAIKFNVDGGLVEIWAEARDKRLVISVRDTGAGVASDDLPRVFERFFRGDKSHSQAIAGTGLGLAIVKHLVEAHQGTVEAESEMGKGSTFRFSLPLA